MVRRLPLVITAAATICNSVALAQRDDSIVGQWTSETYVSGETGLVTLNFYPNGTYARKSVTVTEFGWTMYGSTLLLAPAIEKTESSVRYGKASEIQVSFAGDSMIASAKGQKMTLKRITGEVEEGPLLGRWEGTTDLNETTLQDFRADGKLYVSVTQSREGGRYEIDDDNISFQQQIPLPGRHRSRFKLSGSKLLLYLSDKLPPLELSKVTQEKVVTRSY